MSVVTVQANKNLAVQISVPLDRKVTYHVESEFATTVFLLDAANLAAMRSGQRYTYWGGNNTSQLKNHQTVTLPNSVFATWYLVIVNYNPWPTAVSYTVTP
jgi:hypothetical protein